MTTLPAKILLCCLLLVLAGCDDDDDEKTSLNKVQFKNIALTGAQEVPANSSQATGTFNGTYNRNTKVLTYTLTYDGITPTAMHFHKEAIGQSGGVEVPIGSTPYSSPVTGQTPVLTQDQEADLLAGDWYVNIHSSQFPAGEIRGQLTR